MGVLALAKSSYTSAGVHDPNMPYSPYGPSGLMAGLKREGLLHNMKRGVMESFGIERSGMGHVLDSTGQKVRYGGGLFTSGGLRELRYSVQTSNTPGMCQLGARRGLMSTLGKFAMKGLGPAFFAYSVASEGLVEGTKTAVTAGALFGAGRWALGRIGAAITNPLLLTAAATVGIGIGAQRALIAGRKYNQDIRKFSLGNAMPDTYGNIATMRQASVMAIQSSRINGRNVLSHEASLMHL